MTLEGGDQWRYSGGTFNPGFTRSGSGGPRTKKVKITGTTASTQGGSVSINHNLTGSKILSVSVFVNTGTSWVPPGYLVSAGFQYSFAFNATQLVVANSATNSANILSKGITALIEYEE